MADRDDEDEDALTWAGDADRGRGPEPRRSSRRAASDDGTEADDADRDDAYLDDADRDADEPDAGLAVAAPHPPLTLRGRAIVAVAALGFAVWTVLWFLSTRYNALSYASGDLFLDAMFAFGKFAALIASPVFFLAVFTILRDRGDGIRALWFAIGLVLLLPWPYFLLSGNA